MCDLNDLNFYASPCSSGALSRDAICPSITF